MATSTDDLIPKEAVDLRNKLVDEEAKLCFERKRDGHFEKLDDRGKMVIDELKRQLSYEDYRKIVEEEARKGVARELKKEYRKLRWPSVSVRCILCWVLAFLVLVLIYRIVSKADDEIKEVDCQHLDYSWNSTHFHYKYDVEIQRRSSTMSGWFLGRDYKIEIYGAKKTRLADDRILYRNDNTVTELATFKIPKFNVTELVDYHSKMADLLGYKKHFVDHEYTVRCGTLNEEHEKWLAARVIAGLDGNDKKTLHKWL